MTKQIKLGDAVAKLTKVFGIQPCKKCERRRRVLNKIQRLGIKETVRRMRSIGESKSPRNEQNLEEIINKLNDCCKK